MKTIEVCMSVRLGEESVQQNLAGGLPQRTSNTEPDLILPWFKLEGATDEELFFKYFRNALAVFCKAKYSEDEWIDKLKEYQEKFLKSQKEVFGREVFQ